MLDEVQLRMDCKLAKTIVEVQDVCNRNGLDIVDLPCGAMWMDIVRLASTKIAGDACYQPQFNVKGCLSGRFNGTDEPNTTEFS